jgi:hypothetical protein
MTVRGKDGKAGYPYPARRPLRVFPFDPMVDRAGRSVVAGVTFEMLRPGPSGRLIEVIDYDATRDHLYAPADLDNPGLLLTGGLAPDESDPRFHQQMVYAVAMRVLETFERALGRPFRWRGDRRLRIYPHAFEKRNAYFDSEFGKGALLFGYFVADAEDPGENIPGQLIFTCLTHEIVAHETTHAVLHRLRPQYQVPTNPDVRAFHEGFADIVALLVPFTYHEVVATEVVRTKTDLAQGSPLLKLAEQFGFGKGDRQALRTALVDPSRLAYERATGPHRLGEVLAQAVMAGFLKAYQKEAGATIRLATAGRGLPERGELHPDLVNEVATAATKSAERILGMCIRAIDYLPPVDVTFGDFLRAVVTADADLFPADEQGLRAGLIEAFRERGIYPTGAVSLAERSVQMDHVAPNRFETPLPIHSEFITDLAREFDRRASLRYQALPTEEAGPEDYTDSLGQTVVPAAESARPDVASHYVPMLQKWAEQHRSALELNSKASIAVAGFHASQRRDEDGYNRIVVSVQFMQTAPEGDDAQRLGGIRPSGGATVVADSEGTVRYVISKPYPAEGSPARNALLGYVADLEQANPRLGWDNSQNRIVNHFTLRGIDAERF